jgi:threonine dehydrogenase-like Zn-dependent dehydrogenase
MKALQVEAKWAPREGYKPEPREERDRRAVLGNGTLLWRDPKIGIVDKPAPVPADDEVLLKTGAAGVCGSDTLFLGEDEDGYARYPGHVRYPVVPGHEFSGEIVDIGKNVSDFKVGDIVTAETMNWCGKCMPCRTGMFNQCENLEEIGFTLDGGFAEYMLAKEKFCFNIEGLVDIYGSKEKALEIGATTEPTAVAYNGMFTRAGGFMPGGHVVVFGAGPIGLAGIALAKAAGAARIIAFETEAARTELAKEMGADVVFDPVKLGKEGSSPAEMIMELTKGVGAAMTVEATEHQDLTIPEAEKAMAVGGKIVQLGIRFGQTPVTAFNFQRRGCKYIGSIGSAGHGIWASVIRLMASGRIDTSKMATKRFNLENVLEAINGATMRKEGKILVTPHW